MKIIEAYECTCDKCGYVWSSIKYPVTCANKPCRSPRWNKPVIVSNVPLAAPEEAPEEPQIPERFNMYYKIQERIDPEKAELDKKALIESLRHLTIPGNKPTDSVLPTYAKVETDDVTIDYGEI